MIQVSLVTRRIELKKLEQGARVALHTGSV